MPHAIDGTYARYVVNELNSLITEADGIASKWSGDEPGQQEDDAMVAQEIIDKAIDLKQLLEGQTA